MEKKILKVVLKLVYIVRPFRVDLCNELGQLHSTPIKNLIPYQFKKWKSSGQELSSFLILWNTSAVQKKWQLLPSHTKSLLEISFFSIYLELLDLLAVQKVRNVPTKRRILKQNRWQLQCSSSPQLAAGPRRNNWLAYFDVAMGLLLLHMGCHWPQSFIVLVDRDVSADFMFLFSKGKIDPQKEPKSRLSHFLFITEKIVVI